MTITLISGKPRNGKTLLVAYRALYNADNDVKVHTNFSLFDVDGKGDFVNGSWSGRSPDCVSEITLYDLVKLFVGERCPKPEKITLQEWYGWLSSHKSLSDVNDFQSALIFQSGKLGYDFIGDSQVTMRVDNSVRILADERFEAVRESVCDRTDCPDDCSHMKDCVFRYYELDTSEPNEDVRTGNFFEIDFDFASRFWNRYDTWCRTLPIGLNAMVAKMASVEPEIMDKLIESQVEMLLKKADLYGLDGRRKTSVIMVKDALVREHQVTVFASYVANRIELRLR